MLLLLRLCLVALALAVFLPAQEAPRSPPPQDPVPSSSAAAALVAVLPAAPTEALPDAPGMTLLLLRRASLPDPPQQGSAKPAALPPCPRPRRSDLSIAGNPSEQTAGRAPCQKLNPYRAFLNNATAIPLKPNQKAYLAVHDVVDPFNLLTIGLNAALTVAINSHNAYDPGLRGFAWDSLYSLSQDATGEFIGTFAVCSLLHEDPHYHRLVEGTARQRFLHALSRTWVAQRDDGRMMPNYEKFITYPASAELSNLYVPGVAGNGPSTVERILTGLASDPIDNLITEFLPDFASRIHVHVVFVQQLINQVAAGQI